MNFLGIDNDILSIPAKPDELWKVKMQIHKDSMKVTVVDPIVIYGQYFDF